MKYTENIMISKDYEVYYKTAKPQTDTPLHYHDYLEIYYHKLGDCDYIIDSRIYTLKPGDLMIIRSQKLHKAVIKDLTSEYERYVLWMTNEFISQLIEKEEYRDIIFSREENAELMRLPAICSDKIKIALDSMVEEANQQDAISKDLEIHYLKEILLLICKFSKSHYYIKNVEPKQDPLVKEIMEYLDGRILEKISLDDVADYFYMNKYHLMRKFKRHTKMTIMDYLKKKRLMIARNLIAEGEPIQEIYRMCGFDDYSNFFRAFKSIYGMAPSEYKRYMQNHHHNVLSLQLDNGFMQEEH